MKHLDQRYYSISTLNLDQTAFEAGEKCHDYALTSAVLPGAVIVTNTVSTIATLTSPSLPPAESEEYLSHILPYTHITAQYSIYLISPHTAPSESHAFPSL